MRLSARNDGSLQKPVLEVFEIRVSASERSAMQVYVGLRRFREFGKDKQGLLYRRSIIMRARVPHWKKDRPGEVSSPGAVGAAKGSRVGAGSETRVETCVRAQTAGSLFDGSVANTAEAVVLSALRGRACRSTVSQ